MLARLVLSSTSMAFRVLTRLGLLVATTLGACAQGSDAASAMPAEPLALVGLDVPEASSVVPPSSERPRGIYAVRDASADGAATGARAFGPKRARVIYMNRHGGTYSPGNEDSAKNTSIVPKQPAAVAAWSHGDAAWQQLMACVRDQYARFDVSFVETEPPANVDYIESVVGGTPGQLGLPSGVGGIAPMNTNCSVVERGVAFTFAGAPYFTGNVQAICEVVAQETAHALGLDHEFLCEDPMTYLGGCGAKAFQDVAAPCGEDAPRPCMCGDATQNSVQVLLQVLGPADTTPPTVELVQPANGATVAPGFAVQVDAVDAGGRVTKVDLFIDGQLVGSKAAAPYDFVAPLTMAGGTHIVKVRAYDAGGKTADATAQVTVQSAGGDGTGGGDDTGGDDGTGDGTGGGDGTGDGTGDGDGTGGAVDEPGAPPTLIGGCAAVPVRGESPSGLPALLLGLAALVLALRRRLR